MTTLHDGFLLRQLILENRVCEIKLEIDEQANRFRLPALEKALNKAVLAMDAGRTRFTDNEMFEVMDMLSAMGKSAMEEARQHSELISNK